VPSPRAGGTCGDGRRDELEEVVADDEERRMAGNGAAAGFPGDGACGDEGKVQGAQARERGAQGLKHNSYRGKGEERPAAKAMAIDGR
jgi:hypothetical protein